MDLDPGTGGLLDEGADTPGLVAGEVVGHRPAGRQAQRVLGVDLLGRGAPLDRVEPGLAVAMGEALLEQPGGAGMVLARAGPEDALLGGWQFSGIERWSSGLPFSLFEPGWTTDWELEGFGVKTSNVKLRRHFDSSGNPQFFDNAQAINSGTASGTPIRLPYPGETGDRNNFRGDGLFNIDSGLSKFWKLGEFGALKFAWEVFNVTNTVRFDPGSIGSQLTSGNLGVPNALLSQGRRMQFSLRYDF